MPLNKPFEKSDKTITFVGEDGQEIEVVSNISKGALAVLTKQGYKKQSQRHKEQEDAALKKHGADDEVEVGLEPQKPARKATSRS